jgi:hypothetical protein
VRTRLTILGLSLSGLLFACSPSPQVSSKPPRSAPPGSHPATTPQPLADSASSVSRAVACPCTASDLLARYAGKEGIEVFGAQYGWLINRSSHACVIRGTIRVTPFDRYRHRLPVRHRLARVALQSRSRPRITVVADPQHPYKYAAYVAAVMFTGAWTLHVGKARQLPKAHTSRRHDDRRAYSTRRSGWLLPWRVRCHSLLKAVG